MACCLSINFFFLFALSVAGARLESDHRVLGVLKVWATDVEKQAAADAKAGRQEADRAKYAARKIHEEVKDYRKTAEKAAQSVNTAAAKEAEEKAKELAPQAKMYSEPAQAGRDKALKAKKTSERETESKIKSKPIVKSKLSEAMKLETETASAIQAAEVDLEVKKADADAASSATVGLQSLEKSVAEVYKAATDAVDEAEKRLKWSLKAAEQTESVQSQVECIAHCLSQTRKEHDVTVRQCMYFECGISLLSDAAEDASGKKMEGQVTSTSAPSHTTAAPDDNQTGPNDTDNVTEVQRAADRVYDNAGAAVEAATSIPPASDTLWYLNESEKVLISMETKNYSLRPGELRKAQDAVKFCADKALEIVGESSTKLDSAKVFLSSAENALDDVEEIVETLTTTRDEAEQALKEAENELKELNEKHKGQVSVLEEITQELETLEKDLEKSKQYTQNAKNSYTYAGQAVSWTSKEIEGARDEAERATKCREEAERVEKCYKNCDSKDFKLCGNRESCKDRKRFLCKKACIKKKC